MAIYKPNNSKQSNLANAVMKYGAPATMSMRYVEGSGTLKTFDVSGFDRIIDPLYRNFSLGTGVIVNSGGVVLFNNQTNSGSLSEFTFLAAGPNTIYVGINSRTPAISNGYPMSSGQTYTIRSQIINDIWAITNSGTAILFGEGPFKFNPNTM